MRGQLDTISGLARVQRDEKEYQRQVGTLLALQFEVDRNGKYRRRGIVDRSSFGTNRPMAQKAA